MTIKIKDPNDPTGLNYLYLDEVTLFDADGNDIGSTHPLPVTIMSPLESNGAIPVNVQDQYTDSIDAYLTRKIKTDITLDGNILIEATQVELSADHGAVVGNMLSLYVDGEASEGYIGQVLEVATNTISLDTPVDYAFPDGSFVALSDKNLGSAAATGTIADPIIYSISAPPIGLEFDITRLSWAMTCASAIDLNKFGDLSVLTNGIVIRVVRASGAIHNLMNVKNNIQIMLHAAGDYDPYVATNPSHGIDGLSARMTWASPGKRGVTIRLDGGDSLQALVQDNQTGLTTFNIQAHMHIVTNS